jgi:ADP-L-glycero-D-manno-heptose 6-epimerase
MSHNKKVLVTGATGFIGSNLTRELVSQGYEVIAVGRDHEQSLADVRCQFINRPFYDINFSSFGRIDALFHQAAIVDTTEKNESNMFFVNSTAPKRMFKEAIRNGCRKIVYASSTAVYGNSPPPYKEGIGENPLNVYGESKLFLDRRAMELAQLAEDVSIIGLRYCNVYGPGENHKGRMANMVYQLAQQMKSGNPRIFKFGEQKRDQIYVKDVVKANLCALNANKSCFVNCGTGKPVSFNEMISVLNEVTGLNRETEYIDNPYSSFFQTHTECDMSLAEKMIGFKSTYSFREGVKEYYDSGALLAPPIEQK